MIIRIIHRIMHHIGSMPGGTSLEDDDAEEDEDENSSLNVRDHVDTSWVERAACNGGCGWDAASRSCVIKDEEHERGYEHIPRRCISGSSILSTSGKTWVQCKAGCDEIAACVAFEFGVVYGEPADDCAVGDCRAMRRASRQ